MSNFFQRFIPRRNGSNNENSNSNPTAAPAAADSNNNNNNNGNENNSNSNRRSSSSNTAASASSNNTNSTGTNSTPPGTNNSGNNSNSQNSPSISDFIPFAEIANDFASFVEHMQERAFQSDLAAAIQASLHEAGLDGSVPGFGGSPQHKHPSASISSIRQLPTVTVTREDLIDPCNRECAICLETIGLGKQVLRMPCAHLFHTPCIANWLQSHNNSCPVCRYELPTDDAEYEKTRRERMQGRKPRFAEHELNRLSVKQLVALLPTASERLNARTKFTEKCELKDYLIKSGAIQLVPAPEPVSYKWSELTNMTISQLKTCMNEEAGVFFNPQEVVEKRDMLHIFVNSGRLNIIPEDDDDSNNKNDTAPTNLNGQDYNYYNHLDCNGDYDDEEGGEDDDDRKPAAQEQPIVVETVFTHMTWGGEDPKVDLRSNPNVVMEENLDYTPDVAASTITYPIDTRATQNCSENGSSKPLEKTSLPINNNELERQQQQQTTAVEQPNDESRPADQQSQTSQSAHSTEESMEKPDYHSLPSGSTTNSSGSDDSPATTGAAAVPFATTLSREASAGSLSSSSSCHSSSSSSRKRLRSAGNTEEGNNTDNLNGVEVATTLHARDFDLQPPNAQDHNCMELLHFATASAPTVSSSPPRFEQYSVAQLQTLARERSIDLSGCLERSDIVKRLVKQMSLRQGTAINSDNSTANDYDDNAVAETPKIDFLVESWNISEIRALAELADVDLSNCQSRPDMIQVLEETARQRPAVARYFGTLAPLAGLSVPQLRAVAREQQINVSDCLEKGDIIQRLVTSRSKYFSSATAADSRLD